MNVIIWKSFQDETPDINYVEKNNFNNEETFDKSNRFIEVLVFSDKLKDWYRALYKFNVDTKETDLIIYDSNYILLNADKKIKKEEFTHWTYSPVNIIFED